MLYLLIKVFNIRQDELRPVGLMVALRFCMGATYIIAETAAMTLFLSRFEGTLLGFEGIAALPVLYIMGAIATAAIGALILYLQQLFPVGRLITANLTLIVIFFGIVYFAIQTAETIYLYPILYIAVEVIWVLIALNAEVTVNCIFNVRQAKRVMGAINGGETISIIAGAYAVAAVAPWIGVPNVLLLAAVFGLLSLGLYVAIMRTAGAALTQPVSTEQKRERTEPVYRMRFVLLMAGFMLLTQFAIYITFFQSRAAINLSYEELEIALCLGILEGSIGVARAVLQFLVVNRLIARIGLFPVASLLPVALVVTGIMVVLGPEDWIFALVVTAYAIDRVFRFSFGNSTRPLMYHCLPDRRKIRVQSFIDTVVAPVATGLSGLGLLALGDTLLGGFPDIAAISWSVILIGLLFAPILVMLRREYLDLLLRLARGKRLEIGESEYLDPTAIALLRQRLSGEDPVDAVFAIGTLEEAEPGVLVEAMPNLIHHPNKIVSVRALKTLASLSDKMDLTHLADILQLDDSAEDETQVAMIEALAAILREQSFDRIEPMTGDLNPQVRVAALASLARWAGEQGVAHARPVVETLAASASTESRMQALEVVRDSGVAELWPLVEKLLNDDVPAVRVRALEVVGRLRLEGFYPALLAALDDPVTSPSARWLLTELGEDALPTLQVGFDQHDDRPSRRPALLQLAGRIDHSDAQALLMQAISTDDVVSRQLALEQLFLAENMRLEVDESDRLGMLDDERKFYLDLARIAVVVDRNRHIRGMELLAAALSDALQDTLLRVLYQLRFSYSRDLVRSVHTTWVRPASRHVALEILDNVLHGEVKETVLSMLDHTPATREERTAADTVHAEISAIDDVDQIIVELCKDATGRYGDWIHICALHAATRLDPEMRAQLAEPYLNAANPILREVAQMAVSGDQDPAEADKEAGTMLSTMEKLLFLKKVTIFDHVRDEYLAELARGLEEVNFEEGEVVFRQAELGDSMYVIVSGSIRLEQNGHAFLTLGPGECVGEMAVLDAEPRSATVIAEEDCLLLMIEGRELFDIMATQIEIARGLFKVISTRLREARQKATHLQEQVDDLQAQINELRDQMRSAGIGGAAAGDEAQQPAGVRGMQAVGDA